MVLSGVTYMPSRAVSPVTTPAMGAGIGMVSRVSRLVWMASMTASGTSSRRSRLRALSALTAIGPPLAAEDEGPSASRKSIWAARMSGA